MDLVRPYPPALASLKKIRDERTKSLKDGVTDPSLFNEVESINKKILDQAATVALFRMLDTKNPEFARECFRQAEDSLLAAKEYDLFVRYAADFTAYLSREIEDHDRTVALLQEENSRPDRLINQYKANLINLTMTLAALLSERGEANLAEELKLMTAGSVSDPRLAPANEPDQ